MIRRFDEVGAEMTVQGQRISQLEMVARKQQLLIDSLEAHVGNLSGRIRSLERDDDQQKVLIFCLQLALVVMVVVTIVL